ncbi:P-loop containing nucleoside triphosphate hydrolase protein, partial [Mycena latifolia]
MEIGSRRFKQQYIGGSLGHNNPTTLVVAEAEHIYPSRPIVLVVSIGSGHPDTIQILKSPTPSAVGKAMKRIATDSEKTHQENERRYQGISNTYFRFNVQQGMQALELEHWGKLDQVTAHTEAYLRMEEVKPKLTGTINVLLNPVIHSLHSPVYLKVCSPPTFHFTGREDILSAMEKYFNSDIGQRHIFLLHGLGGTGKSQIAFKFVKQAAIPEPRFSEVYFIDSSSQQMTESDLSAIAHVKGVGKTFQDTLGWLCHQHTEWLMVFNNADDAQLKLSRYFPSCSHGNIIITSRNRTLDQAVGAKLKVEQMELNQATDLLLAAAGYDISEPEYRAIGQQIVEKLHCLPLAVVQAGAYISASCPLQKYLKLHESAAQRIRLLDQNHSQSDYELSVYATWRISFDKVSIQAQELLQLCSFIHHDGITEAIFESAALYQFTIEGPTEVDMQEPLKFLDGLATPTSKWDSLKFLAVTTELGHYSLIDFQCGGQALTFSIHPLVHEWCRTTVSSDSSTELCMHKLIGMAISARCDVLFTHQIFPHLDLLLFKATEGSGRQPNILDIFFSHWCLWVYEQEGKWDDGVDLANSM